MKVLTGRRGSALLIVLGMLSFMVVSAVGFSIYMRASRTPSSYLRRNLAARYLVRAALAKAIGELDGAVNTIPNWGGVDSGSGRDSSEDRASSVPYSKPAGGSGGTGSPFYGIYDDPYPGVLVGDDTSDRARSGDYWAGRVFMPFGALARPSATETYRQEPTVPVLTLEALAYLPPAIINDVRFFARRTRTACWRQLPYDAGRYAYCAVDVSDLLDINRLKVDKPRDSGDNRVTLSSISAGDLNDLFVFDVDKALQNHITEAMNRGPVSGVPFTSLADFNAAFQGESDFVPFMKEFGSAANFKSSLNPLFVTDSWFPPAGNESNAGQPFESYGLKNIAQIGAVVAGSEYDKYLGVGAACLYDYLDANSWPVSLALPTTEAAPMIVGIAAPTMIPEVSVGSEGAGDEEYRLYEIKKMVKSGEEQKEITIKRECKRTKMAIRGFHLTVVAAYPFKRMKTTNRAQSFSYRAIMKVFLATPGDITKSRYDDPNRFLHPAVDAWKFTDNGTSLENGVIVLKGKPSSSPDFSDDITCTADWAKAVKHFTFNFEDSSDMPMFWTVQDRCEDPEHPEYSKGPKLTLDGIAQNNDALRPIQFSPRPSARGNWFDGFNPNRDFSSAEFDDIKAFSDSGKYAFCASVWIQVLDDSSGEVVDMVPAFVEDDEDWRGIEGKNTEMLLLGEKAPFMFFKTMAGGDGQGVEFADLGGAYGGSASYADWGVLYAVDPRFNFAPEDWFSQPPETACTADKWKELIGIDGGSSQIFGKEGRSRDMFMFVSDQEWLQSIGELQFLPALQKLRGNSNFWRGDYSPGYDGSLFTARTSPTAGDFTNKKYFWRTYCAYDNDNGLNNEERRYGNPYVIPFDSEPYGFRLNPFSRDYRILSAVVAGTPLDYYVASPIEDSSVKRLTVNNIQNDINKYTFGAESKIDSDKISTEETKKIVDEIRKRMDAWTRSEDFQTKKFTSEEWDMVWRGFDAENGAQLDDDLCLIWQESSGINDENNEFLDVPLKNAKLHEVDRKFLYSFWRDCFDNRQQLFLIFVRAEPTSVGGGGMSRASSQLGGRAVALVWRDPNPPTEGSRPLRKNITRRGEDIRPHRTRVLFYHQFD